MASHSISSRCVAILFCVAILAHAPALATAATIGLNFTGVTLAEGAALNKNGGYAPPDMAGGVGPTAVAQLINGAFSVYDKTNGQRIGDAISGRQFWINAGVDPGTAISNLGAFNQRILYDPTAGRWIAAALTGDPIDNKVLVARSETSDPSGSWKAVSFLGNAGGEGKFADYTRLGVDANGVYISTNQFTENSQDGGFTGVSVFSIPKTDLMSANPSLANMSRFDDVSTDVVGMSSQPVVNFGPATSTAAIIATTSANTEGVLYRTSLMGTAGAGATLTPDPTFVPVLDYFLPPKAAQPDGTRSVGTIDHRISGHAYQIGNVIYTAHDTKVGDNVAIQWEKTDATTNLIIEQGILSDPNFDYFQPSIAANANGDIVIGFTRSGFGSGGNLSDFAVVGKLEGGVTTFGSPMLLMASAVGNYHYINSRWGDYSTTVVDPNNPNVFWTFQEYATGPNAWATQITQILVPEPETWTLAAGALVALMFFVRRQTQRARAGLGNAD